MKKLLFIALVVTLTDFSVANAQTCVTNKYAGGKITYFNFKDFPDDWRFNIEETTYMSNKDAGTFAKC